ncbi:MAG: hypothetical protein WCF67_00065 [Chitinophagaceae bacterium]
MFKNKKLLIISIISIVILLAGYLYYKRNFYCYDGSCITVWKPAGKVSYVIDGKYYGMFPPGNNYFKGYSSKSIMVCWNDSNRIAFCVQSLLIDRKGFTDANFYDQKTFFRKFTGQVYENGKLITDSDHSVKDKKYSIEYIEL